jgi:creatinine amidohydrolase/Fe(II)-dependent formamide hydrolase-like protein
MALSAISELNRVHDTKDSHARLIPTSVLSAISKSQIDCKCENNNNKHSVNGRAWAETNLGASEFTWKNDVVKRRTFLQFSCE